jgi:hypothetical protein
MYMQCCETEVESMTKGYGVWRHIQRYFSHTGIVAIIFIGGGNQSTRRKPQICRNQ